MASSLDSYLGIHVQALSLEAQRTQVLAANLANVDTPNYKARDIDFKAALAAETGATSGAAAGSAAAGGGVTTALALSTTQAGQINPTGVDSSGNAATSALKYRVPLAPSLDGNTVDEQLEQSAFAQNNVRYQATLTFLNTKLRALMTAITGQ